MKNNKSMENNNKEKISTISDKKVWSMPELIVIDKKVIEGGMYQYGFESGVYYGS